MGGRGGPAGSLFSQAVSGLRQDGSRPLRVAPVERERLPPPQRAPLTKLKRAAVARTERSRPEGESTAGHFAQIVKAARARARAEEEDRRERLASRSPPQREESPKADSPEPEEQPKPRKTLRRKSGDSHRRSSAVNALELGADAALRGASPCSPEEAESPPVRTPPVRAEAPAKPRKAAGVVRRSRKSSGQLSKKRACSRSSDTSPAAVRSNALKRPRVSKTAVGTAAAPPAAEPTSPSPVASPKSGGTPQKPVISPADEGTFQTAVLERLRSMCGEHEDAQVLAEYVVVMVAGNKHREEMSVELKPFFAHQTQAESFVDWVEECKWKFLTGGPSPVKPSGDPPQSPSASPEPSAAVSSRSVPAGAGVFEIPPARGMQSSQTRRPATFTPAVSPLGHSRAQLAPNHDVFTTPTRGAASVPVKPGPHVAVTSRVVLQPHPDHALASSPPAAAQRRSVASPGGTTADGGGHLSKAAAASRIVTVGSVKREKNQLLESMTKQLQTILTKLKDTGLNDETREKYQALAANIQMQMGKITKPVAQPGPVRRRM